MWFNIFLCVFKLIVLVNCAKDGKLVKIFQGTLEGEVLQTSFTSKHYYSFKGIPYAEPCIGTRKFDIARPPQPWQDTYDASFYRPACPQMDIHLMQNTGNEDCLYLNVFTPSTDPTANLTVMVYFYAGLYQLGHADDDFYDPEFLVEKNVVVVTFNHRLGPLGFISTADGYAPGNVGMKDQVRALRWVQDNILQFGGNPEKVTLFGQSSGATSVHLHMMSPMSQGLFRACIMQSGTGVSWWAISRDPRRDAFALGRALNLHTNDTKELMDHLKNTPTADILEGVTKLYEDVEFGETKRDDIFPFAPCVENNAGQEVFLPDEPWAILRSGRIAEVPLIIGITADEATVLDTRFIDNEIIQYIISYMCHVLKIRDDYAIMEVLKYVEEFYLQNKTLEDTNENDTDVLVQWLSDMSVNVETLMTAKIMSIRSGKNVYLYKFSYLSSFGLFKELMHSETVLAGVAHGDDLTYLFHTHMFEHKQIFNAENQKMIDLMTKLWTNFAKNLDPTSSQDTDINFIWYPLNNYNRYLNIDVEPQMEKNLFTDSVRLWSVVFKNDLKEYAEIFN